MIKFTLNFAIIISFLLIITSNGVLAFNNDKNINIRRIAISEPDRVIDIDLQKDEEVCRVKGSVSFLNDVTDSESVKFEEFLYEAVQYLNKRYKANVTYEFDRGARDYMFIIEGSSSLCNELSEDQIRRIVENQIK